MPKISFRGENMPASPIRKLVPFAEKAKIRGVKIYHLNIGQPDIETPHQMMDAVKNTNLKVLEYSHSAGFESYRRKLVQYYAKYGIELNHHQIMITTGGSEAILFGMMCCLDAGDEVIIPEPLYANYNGFTTASNIVVKPITSYIETGFALPPISEFEKLITPKTKAILICNPNNPTGYLYTKEELLQLRDLVLKYDLFLFADEVYREFVYDGNEQFSVLNMEGIDENVVLMDSISKRYSACGARIGALISKNNKVMETALKFAQARLSPPTLEQILAEAFLDVPDSYFTEVEKEYVERRNLCVERLNAMDGVLCPTPGGAFYAIARLPIDDSDKFCQWLLESFHLNNETVMLAPATGFYSTPGLGKNEVRIAYVLNKNDINKAMDCLDAALKVYPGRVVARVMSSEV
ncbi:MAG: pyridoxal phosphate-dependent aminotransferase [Bacteroidetes bacterium]|jgi:aspartate aminotransferase|nr:pyridoxal phosphate-dependent aminotransferase [Bacteroidota bacterium]MBK7569762.1 pyridoxal phosphate-dependent aminotransferase [Bacteroidota bacterium]